MSKIIERAYVLMASSFFLSCLPLFAQPTKLEEQLIVYKYPSQINTVARREYKDQQGKIVKTIYYAGGWEQPIQEDKLSIQSIEINHHNNAGLLVRSDRFDEKMKLQNFRKIQYLADGEIRNTYYSGKGIRTHETRRGNDKKSTELHFDSTGKKLVYLRGDIPSDVKIPFAWSETESKFACSAHLVRSKSTIDDLEVEAIAVHLLRLTEGEPYSAQMPPAEMEIRDAKGNLISSSQSNSLVDQTRISRSISLPDKGKVNFIYPAYDLREYFPNLPPGRYTVRVKLPIKGLAKPLISKPLVIYIPFRNKN